MNIVKAAEIVSSAAFNSSHVISTFIQEEALNCMFGVIA